MQYQLLQVSVRLLRVAVSQGFVERPQWQFLKIFMVDEVETVVLSIEPRWLVQPYLCQLELLAGVTVIN